MRLALRRSSKQLRSEGTEVVVATPAQWVAPQIVRQHHPDDPERNNYRHKISPSEDNHYLHVNPPTLL
ncbi:MAG: hypothetical protein Q7S32_04515 [bacterium]|nr:hypothetical protein [bacterium]